MSKSYEEQATEITIAWLQAKGAASTHSTGVPKAEEVKEFWEIVFKAINTVHNRIHEIK